MSLRDTLLTVCDVFVSARSISRARLSTLLFNGGHVLDRISSGGDLATGNFEKAMQWLSDNWPDGAEWPDGIARPAKTEQ